MSEKRTQHEEQALAKALAVGFEPMPREAKASVWERVLAEMHVDTASSDVRLAYLRAAAVFAVCFVVLGATSIAAATALPGDVLYPVKRAMEETTVALSPGRSDDALVEQTHERADEMRRLMERDAPAAAVDKAAEGFSRAAVRAVEQQKDAVAAERTMRRIEEGVADQPARVQERIKEEFPDSTGGSQGSSGSSGSSSESSGDGDAGSGSGSGSGGSSAPKGSGEEQGSGSSSGDKP